MIKLNISTGPAWIELFAGVRVLVHPARTSLMLGARDDVWGNVAPVAPVESDDEDESDGAVKDAQAFDRLAFNKAVARRAIADWEGVGDPDGVALPVTPDTVDAAMEDYRFWGAFQEKYIMPANAVVDEGNASGPSLNGTTATGPTTAADASGGARTAPTSNKGRKA